MLKTVKSFTEVCHQGSKRSTITYTYFLFFYHGCRGEITESIITTDHELVTYAMLPSIAFECNTFSTHPTFFYKTRVSFLHVLSYLTLEFNYSCISPLQHFSLPFLLSDYFTIFYTLQ